MTIKENIIAVAKELQITAEDMGFTPVIETKEVVVKDEKLIRELKEMIAGMVLNHEDVRENISEEYWDDLDIREKPKYKIVEVKLNKTIYKTINVAIPEDESADDAENYIDDYPDNDYPDDEEDWEVEYCDVMEEDLTADEIKADYEDYTLWNYNNFEQ